MLRMISRVPCLCLAVSPPVTTLVAHVARAEVRRMMNECVCVCHQIQALRARRQGWSLNVALGPCPANVTVSRYVFRIACVDWARLDSSLLYSSFAFAYRASRISPRNSRHDKQNSIGWRCTVTVCAVKCIPSLPQYYRHHPSTPPPLLLGLLEIDLRPARSRLRVPCFSPAAAGIRASRAV